MANFLVSTSGHFIQYNLLYGASANFDIDFNPQDFNIIFDDETGRIISFVLDQKHYTSVYDKKTREPRGYFPTIDFYNKKANAQDYKKSGIQVSGDEVLFKPEDASKKGVFQVPNSGEPVLYNPEEDRIFLVRRTIVHNLIEDKHEIKIHHKSFKYIYGALFDIEDFDYIDGNYFGANDYLEEEETVQFSDDRISTYAKNIIERNHMVDGQLVTFTQKTQDIIQNIALIFDALYREQKFHDLINQYNLGFIFDKHFQIINDNSFSVINEDEYYGEFTKEYFVSFRFRLLRFLYWAKTDYIFDESKLRVLAIIYGLFTNATLRNLDYQTEKLPLFKQVMTNLWVSGRWWFANVSFKLTEEELIVKIINSIIKIDISTNEPNYDDINHFMDLLEKPPEFFEGVYNWFKVRLFGNPTLFQVLYMDIDDAVLFGDDGKGAKGKLMNAIYRLWLNSRYNPENSDIFPDTTVNYDYTTYNAYWKIEDENEDDEIDESAAPNMINYESDRVLLWYDDNFNFPFVDHKIVALEEKQKTFGESVLSALGSIIMPIKPFSLKKYIPYGYYHIFQPVSLRNTDALDTIIKIPFNGNLANPCDTNNPDAENTNSIPIFYLKYVDDLGDYSDFKEAVGTVTDVVLTFTGVWNITKIRHLAKASLLRRYLFSLGAAVTQAEKAALMRTLKFAFSSWEIALGTTSIFNNVFNTDCTNYDPCNPPIEGTSEYEQFQRCQAIDKWLFALDILTMSGDYLARRYFKKRSRDLGEVFTEQEIDNIPQERFDELPDETPLDRQQLKNILNALTNRQAEYDEWTGLLRQNGYNDFADELDLLVPNDAYQFMDDYKIQEDAWSIFNTNTNLVNTWTEVSDLFILRKNVDVLRNIQNFSNDLDYAGTNLLQSFMSEVNHIERGPAIRERIRQNPDDIQDIMEPLLKDPMHSFGGGQYFNSSWTNWRRTLMWKYRRLYGNLMEELVEGALKLRSGQAYNTIKDETLSLIGKNIEDYEFFAQVQLSYGSGSRDYFIADQLLVKYDIDLDDGEKFISDIIIFETKLTNNAPLSNNQKEALLKSLTDPDFKGFKVRNKPGVKEAFFDDTNILDNRSGYITFENVPTFIKISDTLQANLIEELRLLDITDTN